MLDSPYFQRDRDFLATLADPLNKILLSIPSIGILKLLLIADTYVTSLDKKLPAIYNFEMCEEVQQLLAFIL